MSERSKIFVNEVGHYVRVLVASLVLGAGIAVVGGFTFPNLGFHQGTVNGPVAPTAQPRGGPELMLIYIGSSTCRWCNAEELPPAIEELKDELRRKAEAENRSFVSVGLSKDADVESGLDHLRKMGRFDEIATGRGWLNGELLRYVFTTHPGKAATPQILVIDRTVAADPSTGYSITDEQLVMRMYGLQRIVSWSQAGAPLPALEQAAPEEPTR